MLCTVASVIIVKRVNNIGTEKCGESAGLCGGKRKFGPTMKPQWEVQQLVAGDRNRQ